MVKNLILYGHSGFDCYHLKRLLQIVSGLPDCAIILMENAVQGTSQRIPGPRPFDPLVDQNIRMYCVAEDVDARGLPKSEILQAITPINYSDVIELIGTAERVISWL